MLFVDDTKQPALEYDEVSDELGTLAVPEVLNRNGICRVVYPLKTFRDIATRAGNVD